MALKSGLLLASIGVGTVTMKNRHAQAQPCRRSTPYEIDIAVFLRVKDKMIKLLEDIWKRPEIFRENAAHREPRSRKG
jgi:hypothetical protein